MAKFEQQRSSTLAHNRMKDPWMFLKEILRNLEFYRIGQLQATPCASGSVSGQRRNQCQMINIQSLVETSSMHIVLHAHHYTALGEH